MLTQTSSVNKPLGFIHTILCICVCVTIDAMLNCDIDVESNANIKCEHNIKNYSHIMSTFTFDLCRPVLEKANVKCEHHHLLPWNPFMTFDENSKVDADVTCEQGLKVTVEFTASSL